MRPLATSPNRPRAVHDRLRTTDRGISARTIFRPIDQSLIPATAGRWALATKKPGPENAVS